MCLRWGEGGASHAGPTCGIWDPEDPSPRGGKICLPSSGSLATLSLGFCLCSGTGPALPCGVRRCGQPSDVASRSYITTALIPRSAARGVAGGLLPTAGGASPAPSPRQTNRRGPAFLARGPGRRRAGRKQGPRRLSCPSPTPDKNSPRVPGPPYPPLSHGQVPAQLLFLLPGAPFPEGLRVRLGLGPGEQMPLPTPGARRRLSLLRDGRDAAGSSGSRVGGLGWHVRGRSCKPRRRGKDRGGRGGRDPGCRTPRAEQAEGGAHSPAGL